MTKLIIFFSSLILFSALADINFEEIEMRKKQEWKTISGSEFSPAHNSIDTNKQTNADYVEDTLSTGQSAILKTNPIDKNKNENAAKTKQVMGKKVQFKKLHQKYFPEEVEYK